MKYTIKQISDLSKEIAKSLDDYLDDIHTTEKNEFEKSIDILLQTLKDIEQI
jgi:hypothetical protein